MFLVIFAKSQYLKFVVLHKERFYSNFLLRKLNMNMSHENQLKSGKSEESIKSKESWEEISHKIYEKEFQSEYRNIFAVYYRIHVVSVPTSE